MRKKYLIILVGFLTILGCITMARPKELPAYVMINDPESLNKQVLRTPAETVELPLSRANRAILSTLTEKFDKEENCAGLAAPQIGFNKRMIIFSAEDPELKAWRADLTDTMGRTIWINPTYQPLSEEKTEDYEGCFSVKEAAGPVKRYSAIRYRAYTEDGKLVTGTAKGYLARVIQHEIDHLNGKLFIDYVPEGKLLFIKAEDKK